MDETRLNLSEQSLYAAFARGDEWSPSYHRGWLQEQGVEEAASDEDDVVHADMIVKALLGEVVDTSGTPLTVDHKGVRVRDARIVGELDLTAIHYDKPLECRNCAFENMITLTDAKLGRLTLDGSSISIISAENARIDGDLSLDRLSETVFVVLRRAVISGLLSLQGTPLNAAKHDLDPIGGRALNCDGATIGASVFLRNEFVAEGEVNFVRASIGGNLGCDGSTFRNPGGVALECDGATIGARVFLRKGFVAEGEVSFLGAKVGGDLDCLKATFRNPDGRVLSCGTATIGANVFLKDGFVAEGEVNFVGAKIGGQLSCINGTFRNPDGRALNCNAASIGSAAFLREGFVAEGEVNFLGAKIGGTLDCRKATFRNPDGRALNCGTATIGADVFLQDGFVAEGEVAFLGAKIGGNLQCRDASFDAKDARAALNMTGVSVGETLYLTRLEPFSGRLVLRDAKADFLCDDGSAWNEPSQKGKLVLDGFVYERLTDEFDNAPKDNANWRRCARWLRSQEKDHLKKDFRPQPWSQCAKVLRAMGHARGARMLLHEREKHWLRSGNTGFIQALLGPLMNFAAGHGYRNERSVFWLFVLWFFFSLIFQNAWDGARMHPVQGKHPDFHALAYSADILLPIVDIGQDRAFVIASRNPPTFAGETPPLFSADTVTRLFSSIAEVSLYGVARWAETLLGWFLVTIAVAGFSGLLQRKDE